MEDLKKLKEAYLVIKKKHNLPSFEELNKDFKIEKLAEVETDFLIREVRCVVSDTFDHFLRFIEALLNPVDVPIFLYPVIKSLGSKDKEKLTEIHKKVAALEIGLMKLLIYSEEKEVEFIKKAYNLWQEVKVEFVELIEVIEKKLDIKLDKKNNSYFG